MRLGVTPRAVGVLAEPAPRLSAVASHHRCLSRRRTRLAHGAVAAVYQFMNNSAYNWVIAARGRAEL